MLFTLDDIETRVIVSGHQTVSKIEISLKGFPERQTKRLLCGNKDGLVTFLEAFVVACGSMELEE